MTENKEIVKVKRSKSFLFVFPMLSESINDFLDNETKELRSKGFSADIPECFIRDVDKPEYTNHIFLLYKFNGTKEFGIFEDGLTKHPFFVEMYNPTPRHDMFVFGVPDDFQLEYELFKSEKPRIYRRFGEQYKQQVMNFLDPLMDRKAIESILYSYKLNEHGKPIYDMSGRKIKSETHENRFRKLESMIGTSIPRDLDNFSIPIIEEETFNKNKYL